MKLAAALLCLAAIVNMFGLVVRLNKTADGHEPLPSLGRIVLSVGLFELSVGLVLLTVPGDNAGPLSGIVPLGVVVTIVGIVLVTRRHRYRGAHHR